MTTLPAPEKSSADTVRRPPAAPTRRRRHWLRWLVVTVVLLLLVVFGAGGWYFSGRIESGALASTPAPYLPAYNDVQVVAVSGSAVTLKKGPDVADNFDAAGSYALAWQGGTGHIGTPIVNANGTVTRPLTVASGVPPVVNQMAGVDRSYWFGNPPVGFDHPMEEVMIGQYPAWYFPAGTTSPSTIAVVLHGQNGSRLDGLRVVDGLEKAKLPSLVITYRNDVGAPKDASGRLQYGQTEWQDLDAAVAWALSKGAKDVVLVGQSMGGAVVAAFLEKSTRSDKVSAVVLDAPMLSLDETVRNGARTALPGGNAVPEPLLWVAQRLTSLRYGVDWAATDYLDDTSWLTVPTLVLHGTADPTVPVSVSRTLKELEPDLVDLEEFPDALHVESWNFDPDRYEQVLRAFVAGHAD
jgi:dienelactone hydrolase